MEQRKALGKQLTLGEQNIREQIRHSAENARRKSIEEYSCISMALNLNYYVFIITEFVSHINAWEHTRSVLLSILVCKPRRTFRDVFCSNQ